MTSESALKTKIAAWLRSRGFFYQRFAGSAFVRSGVPDFFIAHTALAGWFCWFEGKAPGRYKDCWEGCKKDSPAQYEFLRKVQMCGGLALCSDSFDEVTSVLSAYIEVTGRV